MTSGNPTNPANPGNASDPARPLDDTDAMPTLPVDPLVARLAERFATPISGYAYGRPLRIIAGIVTVFSLVFALFALVSSGIDELAAAFVPVAVAAGMMACCWFIVMGRTQLDADGISQQWIMPKTYRWDEIFRARLLKLPLNTRLILNTGKPPFKTIHAGTPALIRAFEEVADLYTIRNPSYRNTGRNH